MKRILLVEDDTEFAFALTRLLKTQGYEAHTAADANAGLHAARSHAFEAVLLDLGLPRLDGLSVLRRWRAAGRAMPVLILTARDAWTEKVEGLNAGADDYLAKPVRATDLQRALERATVG